MPRILRNYLISFAIIGAVLTVVHFVDMYLQSQASTEDQVSTSSPQTEHLQANR